MVYIDLNMVRAGVVRHPSEWPFSGYNEIQKPRERYALIDYRGLTYLLDFGSTYDFAEAHRFWVEQVLRGGTKLRESKWTEKILKRGRTKISD